MGNCRLPQLQELKPKALVTRILIARVKQAYKVGLLMDIPIRLLDLLVSNLGNLYYFVLGRRPSYPTFFELVSK